MALATEEMGPVDAGLGSLLPMSVHSWRMVSEFSLGCRRLWSAHNCNGTVRLSDCARSVIACGI
jgi:hypothetical protein